MSAEPRRRRELHPEAIADLRALLGGRLSTAAAVRDHHSRRDSYHPPASPDAVAYAHSNFQLIYLVDPDTPEEMAEAGRLNGRMVLRALAMGAPVGASTASGTARWSTSSRSTARESTSCA